MSITDEPITRVTSLAFSPDDNIRLNGMFTPRLTPAEIAAIPATDDKVGGIVFNLQSEELQYLAPTLNWINITTDLADPTFTDLTVSGTSTLNIINGSGLATLASALITNNLYVSGTMFGKRASGGLYNTNTPSFAVIANTPIKIPGTTVAALQNSFTAGNNRLTFGSPTPSISTITGAISAEFSFQFSTNAVISLLIAVTDVPQNPISTQSTATSAHTHLSVHPQFALANNDYVELWVVSDTNGTFSAGGIMNLYVNQT
jgi:hypothetical protein